VEDVGQKLNQVLLWEFVGVTPQKCRDAQFTELEVETTLRGSVKLARSAAIVTTD